MRDFDGLIDRLGSTATLADNTTMPVLEEVDPKQVELYTRELGFSQPTRSPSLFYCRAVDVGKIVPGGVFSYAAEAYRAGRPSPPVMQQDRLLAGRIAALKILTDIEFPDICNLWQPAPLTVRPNKTVSSVPSYIRYIGDQPNGNQSCQYLSTPEYDVPAVHGRAEETNIFTADAFQFGPGVPVEDGWVIQFLSPGNDYGQWWIAQGNSQSMQRRPYWPAGTPQQVYARRLPGKPAGVP